MTRNKENIEPDLNSVIMTVWHDMVDKMTLDSEAKELFHDYGVDDIRNYFHLADKGQYDKFKDQVANAVGPSKAKQFNNMFLRFFSDESRPSKSLNRVSLLGSKLQGLPRAGGNDDLVKPPLDNESRRSGLSNRSRR